MFRDATDLEHPCRLPGTGFLRCLKESAEGVSGGATAGINSAASSELCAASFSSFDQCRKGILAQQEEALRKSIMVQDLSDQRAKAMFERRTVLQDTLVC